MIEEPKALTISRPSRRPTAAQIEAFQKAPTCFVVDAMNGRSAMDATIRPLHPSAPVKRVAGPALTAGNGPGDIRGTFGAMNFVQNGDIIIASADGYQGCATCGDRLAAMMVNQGAMGFVTDGPMRDLAGILETGLPCWCTGLTPNTPFSNGPGTVGLPIQIGGQQVETGDMIIADEDGVVVVPFDQIADVLARLERVIAAEAALDAQIGQSSDLPDHIRRVVEGDDVEFI